MPRKKFNYERDGKHSLICDATVVFLAGECRIFEIAYTGIPQEAQELLRRHVAAVVLERWRVTADYSGDILVVLSETEEGFEKLKEALGDKLFNVFYPQEIIKGFYQQEPNGDQLLCIHAEGNYRQFIAISA